MKIKNCGIGVLATFLFISGCASIEDIRKNADKGDLKAQLEVFDYYEEENPALAGEYLDKAASKNPKYMRKLLLHFMNTGNVSAYRKIIDHYHRVIKRDSSGDDEEFYDAAIIYLKALLSQQEPMHMNAVLFYEFVRETNLGDNSKYYHKYLKGSTRHYYEDASKRAEEVDIRGYISKDFHKCLVEMKKIIEPSYVYLRKELKRKRLSEWTKIKDEKKVEIEKILHKWKIKLSEKINKSDPYYSIANEQLSKVEKQIMDEYNERCKEADKHVYSFVEYEYERLNFKDDLITQIKSSYSDGYYSYKNYDYGSVLSFSDEIEKKYHIEDVVDAAIYENNKLKKKEKIRKEFSEYCAKKNIKKEKLYKDYYTMDAFDDVYDRVVNKDKFKVIGTDKNRWDEIVSEFENKEDVNILQFEDNTQAKVILVFYLGLLKNAYIDFYESVAQDNFLKKYNKSINDVNYKIFTPRKTRGEKKETFNAEGDDIEKIISYEFPGVTECEFVDNGMKYQYSVLTIGVVFRYYSKQEHIMNAEYEQERIEELASALLWGGGDIALMGAAMNSSSSDKIHWVTWENDAINPMARVYGNKIELSEITLRGSVSERNEVYSWVNKVVKGKYGFESNGVTSLRIANIALENLYSEYFNEIAKSAAKSKAETIRVRDAKALDF